MIVLDTNVVSEFMQDHPRPEVLAWLDQQLANSMFVTAVTEAEVRSGIALLGMYSSLLPVNLGLLKALCAGVLSDPQRIKWNMEGCRVHVPAAASTWGKWN